MTAKRIPTPEQVAALRRYAVSHGRYWKHELRLDWYRGTDADIPHIGGYLRQVRNDLGPTWLTRFNLRSAA